MYKDDPRWLSNGWAFQANSPEELMQAVYRIGILGTEQRYAWRGVPDSRYRVAASLIRRLTEGTGSTFRPPSESQVEEQEKFILEKARRWGIGLEVSKPTQFHLLAALQHHGVPTRLLDVTSNPLTALWFACLPRADLPQDVAGALLAFEVSKYPPYRTFTYSDEEIPGAAAEPSTLMGALDKSRSDHRPFTLHPTFKDSRMQAQEGFFISGSIPKTPDIAGIDGMPFPQPVRPPGRSNLSALFAATLPNKRTIKRLPFTVIIVPPAVKRKMREHLEGTFNRNWESLFPDIEGFAEAFRAGALKAEN
ncbi:FRG domain-containing protein [Streptomyces klenkii]|uniref:FRG domain-containing protein n=1 Tax=Streptomyces klenkii TaxID=1420899 RepID=A0A3B0BT78_9ACTN|nr:FRG domain-containing protein [Streptomyces klenkii]RKN76122.1 FRG domain-containing protein [Streptomyces klenkii]